MWPDRRFADLVGIEHPIVQAPMAGSNLSPLAIAVSQAGGLGSLPCAMLAEDKIRSELALIRQQTDRPVNVNFFCHTPPEVNATADKAWRDRLAPYYGEAGLDIDSVPSGPARHPFDAQIADIVLEAKPHVVSFHFGLPEAELLAPLKDAGVIILSSATTVAEARWLEAHGANAIIAQGAEAGGHRGMFLSTDIANQVGTMALVPQVVDAVNVPVIAAGGIADARGVAAAFALGASGVQIGTAFLRCPEAATSPLHRQALAGTRDDASVLTNVMTGRPARGIVNRLIAEVGPMAPEAPQFPLAANAVGPLRAAFEAKGTGDFSPLWSGQAAALAGERPAGEFIAALAQEAQTVLKRLASS